MDRRALSEEEVKVAARTINEIFGMAEELMKLKKGQPEDLVWIMNALNYMVYPELKPLIPLIAQKMFDKLGFAVKDLHPEGGGPELIIPN